LWLIVALTGSAGDTEIRAVWDDKQQVHGIGRMMRRTYLAEEKIHIARPACAMAIRSPSRVGGRDWRQYLDTYGKS